MSIFDKSFALTSGFAKGYGFSAASWCHGPSYGFSWRFGTAGDDTIVTGAGNDLVFSGAGNDRVSLGSGHNIADLGAGNDVAVLNWTDALQGSNLLIGGAGRDTLQIVLTADQAQSQAVKADLAGLAKALAPHGGPGFFHGVERAYAFDSIHAVVKQFEAVDLVAPVLAANDSASAIEDGPAVRIDVLANDTDLLAADKSALTIAHLDASGLPQGASLVVNADQSLTFTPGSAFQALGEGEKAVLSFTYTLADNQGFKADATGTITVEGRNDAPVITSTNAVTMAENGTDTGFHLTATDADASDRLTYSIAGGDDAALFTIDSKTGALAFKAAPDFEKPGDADRNNSYAVTLAAFDGHVTTTDTVTVHVTDVAEITPRINEIHYDNAGSDTGEFVEIRVAANADVSGLKVDLYNGSGGASYGSIALSELTKTSDGAHDYYVWTLPENGIQNGSPDGVALSQDGKVVEFLSYEGTFTATSGPASGQTSTDIGVSESNSTPLGQSLQRSGDGLTDWTGPAAATKGSANEAGGGTGPLPTTTTLISSIQGTGTASLMEGMVVKVSAIVTQTTADGFFLQEEAKDSDGNAASSEGIFVFTGGKYAVTLGDHLDVVGKVTEFNRLTELTDLATVTTVSKGNALPDYAHVTLPLATADALERYEGMRVEVASGTADKLTVTDNSDLARYGEISISAGLKTQPTQIYDAQTEADKVAALTKANGLNTLVIDDGSSAQNPTSYKYIPVDAAQGDNGNGYLDSGDHFTEAGPTLRNGAQLTAPVHGVITETGDGYKVYAGGTLSIDEATNSGARTPAPADVGGTLKVASFNLENYFTTLNERGATSEADFHRQTDKAVAAMSAINADVFGLQEVENNGFGAGSAIDTIVKALNAKLGYDAYNYVTYTDHDTGAQASKIGTDQIMAAIIYKQSAVTLKASDYHVFDDGGGQQLNRPAVLATFEEKGTGEVFNFSANHFKSKGASGLTDTSSPNYDKGDGQSYWNDARVKAAEQLTAWLATDPTKSGDHDVMIMGDLNSYGREDPVQAIEHAGYTNLIRSFIGNDAFSYVFDGQRGTLDQGLASHSLAAQVTGVTEWHINANEPDLLGYSSQFKDPGFYHDDPYRTSDHDPLIVGLNLHHQDPGLV